MSTTPRAHSTAYRFFRFLILFVAVAVVLIALLIGAALIFPLSQSGKVKDEALLAGRSAESLPAADEDYFKDMDGGIPLTVDEVKGRNNWIVWTGGNDRFWDLISIKSFGALDFLKTLSSYPGLPATAGCIWDW